MKSIVLFFFVVGIVMIAVGYQKKYYKLLKPRQWWNIALFRVPSMTNKWHLKIWKAHSQICSKKKMYSYKWISRMGFQLAGTSDSGTSASGIVSGSYSSSSEEVPSKSTKF